MILSSQEKQDRTPTRRKAEVRVQLVELGLLAPALRLFPFRSNKDGNAAPTIAKISSCLGELGGLFVDFARYLGTRVDQFKLEDCIQFSTVRDSRRDNNAEPPQDPSEWSQVGANIEIESQPFLSHGQYLAYRAKRGVGQSVIVTFSRQVDETEFELLAMLERCLRPHLADPSQFNQLREDFRISHEQAANLRILAENLNTVALESESHRAFIVPPVIDELTTVNAVVTEPLQGVRLDHYLSVTRKTAGPFHDGFESTLGYVPEEVARTLCDAWLHLALNCGLVPIQFESSNVLIVSANQIAFTGGSFHQITRATQDNLRKYLVHSCNDDPANALSFLQQECNNRQLETDAEISRMFRQLVPFRQGGWNDGGAINSTPETVFAHIRLLNEHGMTPGADLRESLRGLYGVARLARQLSPVRDSFSEGIKDLRLAGLLENAREILDPIHWTANTDKLIGMLMTAPKNFDSVLDQMNQGSDSTPRPEDRHGHPFTLGRLAVCFVVAMGFFKYVLPGLVALEDKLRRAVISVSNWF